jgi:serine/threonine protein kinase
MMIVVIRRLRANILMTIMKMKISLTIKKMGIILFTLGKLSLVNYIIYVTREIVDSKYIVLHKLGWGHFSTVWLALCLADKKLYALKFQKSAKKYTDSAFDEEGILKVIADNYANPEWVKSVRLYHHKQDLEISRDYTYNLQMFDWFFHNAQHGKHFVMAFEVKD